MDYVACLLLMSILFKEAFNTGDDEWPENCILSWWWRISGSARKGVVQYPSFEIRTNHVENSYKAIDALIKQKPDVVFVDFNLPRADGGQIPSVIKSVEKFSDVPVYVMTGYWKTQVETLLKRVDHSGILKKNDTLANSIVEILDTLDQNNVS
jgi:CheY-like chemotaxis protein